MSVELREVKHYCPFCEEVERKLVETEIGKKCPECGHYLTCEEEPICDTSKCKWFGDAYNMDGDCLAEK